MKGLTPEYQEKAIEMIMRFTGFSRKASERYVDKHEDVIAEWSDLIIPEAFDAGGAKMHDDLMGFDFEYEEPLSPGLEAFRKKILTDNP